MVPVSSRASKGSADTSSGAATTLSYIYFSSLKIHIGVDSNSLGLAPHQRYDTFLARISVAIGES